MFDDQNSIEIPVSVVWNYRHYLNEPLSYSSAINYDRCSHFNASRNCVMCGRDDVPIPRQNKDVCKSCDSSVWLLKSSEVVIKFCKGCKNFLYISEFENKPESSKCAKCRCRGRHNYFARKTASRIARLHEDDNFDDTTLDLSDTMSSQNVTMESEQESRVEYSLHCSFESADTCGENREDLSPVDVTAIERMDPFGRAFTFPSRPDLIQRDTCPSPISPVASTMDPDSSFEGVEHFSSNSPESFESYTRSWEYDPRTNPLMHLAILTGNISRD